MKAPIRYKHYQTRPEILSAEFVKSEWAKIKTHIEMAEKSSDNKDWIDVLKQMNALKAYVYAEGSRIDYRYSSDVKNPDFEAREKKNREEVRPAMEGAEGEFIAALLKSKHRKSLEASFPKQYFKVLELDEKPLAPVNAELRIKEGEIINRYDKLIASAEVEVEGKKMTLPMAGSLLNSPNAATRKEAFLARSNWLLGKHTELAGLFSEIATVRNQMGKNLGFANYLPLGYLGMRRSDYGSKEAKAFRDAVLEHIVPLQTELHEEQAKLLGTKDLMVWDSSYDPSLSLPLGVAPVGEQLNRAQRVFERLSPHLAQYFSHMRESELIDLENRKGKRAGAFCTDFSDEGRAAIFCNSTGDADDVGTLMHEMGHAFQSWESQRNIDMVDLLTPTMDAAEIHSMGMEFLSLDYLDEFFSKEHQQMFKKDRWKQSIELIPYVCIVDEFQHWLYENPSASMTDRDRIYVQIWKKYKPSIAFGEHENLLPMRWYMQGHIFWKPFYYIDYALAETCAMQLAIMDKKNHDQTMKTYLQLCKTGGSDSFLGILSGAGMKSPFESGTIRELVTEARAVLG